MISAFAMLLVQRIKNSSELFKAANNRIIVGIWKSPPLTSTTFRSLKSYDQD